MRKFLISLICLTIVFVKILSNEVTVLKLVLKDATETYFVLSDKPVATFSGDSILFESHCISVGYLRSEIDNFDFQKVDSIELDIPYIEDNTLRYTYLDNRYVIIEGLEDGMTVALYNNMGTLLSNQKVNNGEVAFIVDLEERPAGMYLIAIPNKPTIKIMKR